MIAMFVLSRLHICNKNSLQTAVIKQNSSISTVTPSPFFLSYLSCVVGFTSISSLNWKLSLELSGIYWLCQIALQLFEDGSS